MPATVYVVAAQGIVRRGLELFITAEGFRVIGATSDWDEAREDVLQLSPAVTVISLQETAVEVMAPVVEAARSRVLGLVSPDMVGPLLRTGAMGFVLTVSPPERLTRGLTAVAAGAVFHDELEWLTATEPADSQRALPLTPRERQIVLLLAQGLSGAQIAQTLVLSPATVRTHIQNAMEKCDAHTRGHLIALMMGSGFGELDDAVWAATQVEPGPSRAQPRRAG
jgi:DNA-binding NarL/FixJ family response regulator